MKTEQTPSTEEGHEMWLKASETPGKLDPVIRTEAVCHVTHL